MPSPTLKSRFGAFGDMLYRHANVIDNSPVTPPGEAKSISRETTFKEDTHDIVILSGTLHYQAERVGADLRELGKQTKCVSIKVRDADFTTITRQCTLPQMTDLDQTIYQTGYDLLQKTITTNRQTIRLVGICVSGLSQPGNQLSLMDNAEQRLGKLNKAVYRNRDKYGFSAFQTGRTIQLKHFN
jgi:DNA polymerase-4